MRTAIAWQFPIYCGVSQESPFSSILFLFYISELHNTVHTPEKGVSALGFADNTNLLAFSSSLKSNLLKLKSTHSKCQDWARKHSMKFAPEKYELLHFSRRRKDNLQLSLRLGEVVLQPKEEVRILGLYFDSKLVWKKHQKIMSQKVSKYFSALSRTTYSTWGLPVLTARHVYTAILRSLLSYAVGVWFNPQKKLSNIISLSTFQNKCLRTIEGVFKATPIFLLESELFLPSLDLYFKLRTACFLSSFYSNTLPDSPSTLLHKLHSQICLYVSSLRTTPKSLTTISLNWRTVWLEQLTTNQDFSKKSLQEVFHKEWEARWQVSRGNCSAIWDMFTRRPQKKNLNIFKDLRKAESSLFLQISSLSRTSYSTWSFPVLTSRLVYTAILRSLLSYAVGIWFNPLRKSSNISSLSTFQNKCLRLIGGAFKATPSFLLESELFLLPLDLYFKFHTACFLSSIQTSSLKTLLDNIFSNISHYASSVKKPLKKSSTISHYWKFT